MKEVLIEFTKDYKCAYKKGDRKEVSLAFANAACNDGIAKMLTFPRRDKMLKAPVEMK
jgi:hypothetical protein